MGLEGGGYIFVAIGRWGVCASSIGFFVVGWISGFERWFAGVV